MFARSRPTDQHRLWPPRSQADILALRPPLGQEDARQAPKPASNTSQTPTPDSLQATSISRQNILTCQASKEPSVRMTLNAISRWSLGFVERARKTTPIPPAAVSTGASQRGCDVILTFMIIPLKQGRCLAERVSYRWMLRSATSGDLSWARVAFSVCNQSFV